MCLCTAGLFLVSSPEQILIIRVSKGGEMLRAACVRVAFNLGNAIGAYAGGLAVSMVDTVIRPWRCTIPFYN